MENEENIKSLAVLIANVKCKGGKYCDDCPKKKYLLCKEFYLAEKLIECGVTIPKELEE